MVLGVGGGLRPAAGQPAPAETDSAYGVADTTRVIEVPPRASPDSVAIPATGVKVGGTRSGFDAPRWVMMRSLLVPGWGQAHNRAWIKAGIVAGTEITLAVRIVQDERRLSQLKAEADDAQADFDPDRYNAAVNAYNTLLGQSTTRRWLLGLTVAYAVLDAYVDAHFVDFDVEFENDPALPEGTPPPIKSRLSLRWSF